MPAKPLTFHDDVRAKIADGLTTPGVCRTYDSWTAKSPERCIFHRILAQYRYIDAANPAKSALVSVQREPVFRSSRRKSDRLPANAGGLMP